MKKLISAAILSVAVVVQAETFYWAPAGNVYSDYSDLANWKMDEALTTEATRLPTTGDRLWLTTSASGGATINNASFDLKGGAYVLDGYTGNVPNDSGNYLNVNVKNGTLTINDESKLSKYRAVSHKLTDGATLNVYVSTGSDRLNAAIGGPSYTATYDVKGNSTVNIYNKCEFLQFTGRIEAGSCLAFHHGEICFNNNTYNNKYNDGRYQTYVYNNGTVKFPNGCNWVRCGDGDWSNNPDYTKVFNFYQQGGEVRLGGDFKKTSEDSDAWKRGMYFFFEGGKVVAEENAQVAFLHHTGTKSGVEEVFASVKAAADVTAEPLAGATLDMSIFTYGEGSKLTKTGAGVLKLADLPPTLDVQAGTVELTQTVADLTGVTFANGTKVVFGAANNNFSTSLPANADKLDYAITSAFKAQELVVSVGDATVAGHIRDCINASMPSELSAAGIVAALEGTAVVLKSPLTIAARSFTIVKGAVAADYSAGLDVAGLKGDDTAADTVKAEFTYGGYDPASSAAGIYAVSATANVTGRYYLQGSVTPGTLYVINESDATVFYWNVADRKISADYADVANWKMTVDGEVVAATRLPSSIDRLYPYALVSSGLMYTTTASFDYKGGTYTIAGYGADAEKPDWTDWRSYWLNLTNGTFKILNTRKLDRNSPICFLVAKDAHLDYYAQGVDLLLKETQSNLDAMGAPSVEGRMDIANGGSATVHNPCSFLRFVANIAAGGSLTFADGRYNLDNNNAKHREYRQLNNSGTLSFPNGWDWVTGAVWSDGDGAKTFNINQNAGELRLGGDVKKTGNSRHVYTDELFFNFNGGKLVSEEGKSVAFIQNIGTKSGVEEIFPTVAAAATVEVETLTGSVLDMSIFEYGAGAAMTKSGAGTLKLAAVRPDTLTVAAGKMAFTAALTDETDKTVDVKTGTTIVFGAAGNNLDDLTIADGTAFEIDVAGFTKQALRSGVVLATATDGDKLLAVKNGFVAPDAKYAYDLTISGNSLILTRTIGMVLFVR